MIQTYDPGDSKSDTTETTTNKTTMNKIFKLAIPINLNNIVYSTASIPNQFATRLLGALQKSVPNTTLHSKMYKNGTNKTPGFKTNVPRITFEELGAFIQQIKEAVAVNDNKSTVS